MSTFPAIASGEIDRSSPLTGAVVSAPVGDSVMEKIRERSDYLHEITRQTATGSTTGGVTTDKIDPAAVAIYDATPAGGDGIRRTQLQREAESVTDVSLEEEGFSTQWVEVALGSGAFPAACVALVGGASVTPPASNRTLTLRTHYRNTGVGVRFTLNTPMNNGEIWELQLSALAWKV